MSRKSALRSKPDDVMVMVVRVAVMGVVCLVLLVVMHMMVLLLVILDAMSWSYVSRACPRRVFPLASRAAGHSAEPPGVSTPVSAVATS